MIWLVRHSILSIGLTTALLWIGYEITKRRKGTVKAQEILSSGSTQFLAAIVGIIIFRLVVGIYGFIAAWACLTILSIIWLGSWPLRKLKAGKLLFNIRRPKLSSAVIWLTLMLVTSTGSSLFSMLWLASKTIPKGYLVNPGFLSFDLFLVTFLFIPAYLSIFEGPSFRTNGICYQHKFMPWNRIKSYSISLNILSQEVLTIYWKPTIPIFPRSICLPITSEQIDTIKNTLGEHLEA